MNSLQKIIMAACLLIVANNFSAESEDFKKTSRSANVAKVIGGLTLVYGFIGGYSKLFQEHNASQFTQNQAVALGGWSIIVLGIIGYINNRYCWPALKQLLSNNQSIDQS